jgi:hypothetical protein
MNGQQIQQLINDAAKNGKPAVIPAGTHHITATIKMPKVDK